MKQVLNAQSTKRFVLICAVLLLLLFATPPQALAAPKIGIIDSLKKTLEPLKKDTPRVNLGFSLPKIQNKKSIGANISSSVNDLQAVKNLGQAFIDANVQALDTIKEAFAVDRAHEILSNINKATAQLSNPVLTINSWQFPVSTPAKSFIPRITPQDVKNLAAAIVNVYRTPLPSIIASPVPSIVMVHEEPIVSSMEVKPTPVLVAAIFSKSKSTPTPTPKPVFTVAPVTAVRQSSPTLDQFNKLLTDFAALQNRVNRTVPEISFSGPSVNYEQPTTTGQSTVTDFQGKSVAVTGAISGASLVATGDTSGASLTTTGALTAGTITGGGLSACSGSQFLQWSSGLFSCGTPSGGGGGGSGPTSLEIRDVPGTKLIGRSSISFDASAFNITASGSTDARVSLDYVNGPASRSATQSITGLWTFANAGSATFAGSIDVTKSITSSKTVTATGFNTTGQFFSSGAGSSSFAGSIDAAKGVHTVGALTAGTNLRVGGTSFLAATNVTGLANFVNASLSTNFESLGYASIGGNIFGKGSSNSFGGTLTTTGTAGIHSAGALTAGTDLRVGGSAFLGTTTLGSTTLTGALSLGSNNLSGTGLLTFTTASHSGNLEVGGYASISQLFIGQNQQFKLSATQASTSVNFEFTNVASARTFNGQNIILTAGGSNSFAGSLNTTLGIHSAGNLTTTALIQQLTNAGSNSFAGSLEVAKGIHTIGALTAGTDLRVSGTSFLGLTVHSALASFTVASLSGNLEVTGQYASISGQLIAGGRAFFAGGASSSGNFEIGGTLSAVTGGYASISNTLFVQQNGNVGIGTNNPKSKFSILDQTTTTGVTASISATALTSGGAALLITVPASTSATNIQAFLVKDKTGLVVASLSNGGRLGLRNSITSHGATSNCTGTNTPTGGCVDYAESFPTQDVSLLAGEVVAADPLNASNVVRATDTHGVLGIVSTNPAALIDFTAFLTGQSTRYRQVGTVPVALAGRVPVKISFENGEIKAGDHLTVSKTKPGYAIKATSAGATIGIALDNLAQADGGENPMIMTFVNTSYWAPEPDGSTSILDDMMTSIVDKFASMLHIVFGDGLIKTKKLCLDDVCVDKDQLKQLLQNANLQPPVASPPETPIISVSPPPTSTPSPTPDVTVGETPDPAAITNP